MQLTVNTKQLLMCSLEQLLPQSKYSWKAAAFPERISMLQYKAHSCWRVSRTGVSPANHFLTHVTTSTAEVSLGHRGTMEGYISKHITSHSFGGQSCYSALTVTVSRKKISCSEKNTPAVNILFLSKGRLYSQSLQKETMMFTAPHPQATTGKMHLSSESTTLIHKAAFLHRYDTLKEGFQIYPSK